MKRPRHMFFRHRERERGTLGDCRPALWRRRLAIEQRHEASHRRRAKLFLRSDGHYHPYPFLETFLRLTGLDAIGRKNAQRPVLRHLTFRFPHLPRAFDGFRVLHISDLHLGMKLPDFPALIRDFLAPVEADVCLYTGDSRFEHHGACEHVLAGMREIRRGISAPYGMFAVFGNHDRSSFLEPFRAMGIQVLLNEHAELQLGGERLWIAGVDDPHLFRCDHLELALDGIPHGAFVVLLAHSPEVVTAAARQGVSLYLCGHTHAGQIALPWLGPVHLNARCRRRYAWGVWRCGDMLGYTTAGLGTTDVPVRFNAPPEATLIELRASVDDPS